ncbi:MAG: type II secretion system F family protein [Kiritimatiellia bacterium]|nr:type II secretion system F family protein [Kiritimatiellia bacterium]
MPKFKYTAADSVGNEKSGVVEAVNRPAALLRLKEMGLAAVTVTEFSQPVAKTAAAASAAKTSKPSPARSFSLPRLFSRGLSRKQLMIFTRQLSTMIDAGVPLLRALQIIQKQEKSVVIKRMTGELCEAVEGGSTFAEALAQHQKIFDKLYVNMVKAGEIGGVLQITLGRLAEFVEKAEKIKTKIKGAMIYPIVVLVMALGILSFLLIKIVPKFTEIFKDLLGGQELPTLTRFVVTASNVLVHRAPMVVIVLVVVIIAFNLIGRTKLGRYWFDVAKLKIPVIGLLVLRVGISRFTRTLGTLLNSGVQILQALVIVRDTAGNEYIARAVQSVHDSIKEGESVAAPLEQSGVFPTMVVSMIAVGEETGRLPDMLIKIADTYDTEVDAAVEGLTSVIEPILIIFLALIVGTIVVAMFMPMIGIIQNMSKG